MLFRSGNNEISESITDWFPEPIAPDRFYGEKIFNYIQPSAVHQNSPRIPYMPSSPYFGGKANQVDDGDVHAWTYLGRDPKTKFKFSYELEAFDRMPARFSSEYGFFGAQMESTVQRYHDGEEVVRGGEIWKHHGEFDRKRNGIDGAINRHLTDFSKLDMQGYLLYSGIMQGCLYSEMAEAMRQKPYGAGDLIWMYNDCWPETGWTVIDYYLTRKVSFYFLKRAFDTRKLIVRSREGGAVVTVINETPETVSAEIRYGYMKFTGEKACTGSKILQVPAHSWQQFDFDGEGLSLIHISFTGQDMQVLTSKSAFVPMLVISDVYKGMGWGTIIYFAALSGVDPQLYEAASIDGAKRFKQLLHITIPAIMPVSYTHLDVYKRQKQGKTVFHVQNRRGQSG